MQILREKQLYAKLKKCKFWMEQVRFVGHIIFKEGISVDPMKIEAIKDWPQLTTVMKVQSFLGLAGSYKRFVEEFSQIVTSLTQLIRKGKKFV